ncbi:MAG: hypothetical protein WKG03_00160 [Telluria sp.]
MSRSTFLYQHFVWGEVIRASKEQLQSFGIGADLPFPGDPSQPIWIEVRDPRGYETTIYQGQGKVFEANIRFNERRYKGKVFESPSLGGAVRPRPAYVTGDRYIGTADALVEVGLVRRDQLPGQPGMGKCRVTILANGTVSRKNLGMCEPGAKVIEKASKSTYSISITVTNEERERREKAEDAHRAQHWEYWEDQPRPAPLHAVYREMRRLAMLPPERKGAASEQEFTKGLSSMAALFLDAIKSQYEDVHFRLSDESLAEVEQAGAHFFATLREAAVVPLQSATVTQLHNGFWLRAGSDATA